MNSPEGRELYFLGRSNPGVPPLSAPLDIWVTRRRERGWATAEIVPDPVSTEAADVVWVDIAAVERARR